MDYEENENFEPKELWAFAVDSDRRVSRRRCLHPQRRNLQRYYITACSPRLKSLGIQTGMHLKEARRLAPELRVLICNR